MALPRVELIKDLERSIADGHPWLWDRALRWPSARPAPGALVEVVRRGRPLAVGWADPAAPIAVRILDRPGAVIDAGWARRRAQSAAAMRLGDPMLAGTDAMRLVHGENDDLPGLVIDVYAGWGVAVVDGAGAAAFWHPFIDDVAGGLADAGVALAGLWEKPQRTGGEGRTLRGEPPPDPIVIDEHGARFEVDVRRGQKTGMFLDQRENRRLIRQVARGRDTLNLFSYTGGFSLAAALG
ncbi:MAG TPA: class I SAM-dependent methyltransferase, partial [Kofleriaceae bacterium]|nr:class I SAM-dependent methyltransferase [Kofleriaceae bacterium]